MKILIIARFANCKGGADRFTLEMCNAFALSGHHVTLICESANSEIAKECTVLLVPPIDWTDTMFAWRFAPVIKLLGYNSFISKMADKDFQLVISALPSSVAMLKATFKDAKVLYLPHSRIAPIEAINRYKPRSLQEFFTYWFYYYCERKAIYSCDKLIRFALGSLTALESFYSVEAKEKTLIVPPGTVHSVRAVARNKSDLLRLVVVTRLVQNKNIEGLIAALADIPSRKWLLRIFGEGPQLEALVSQARFLGIEDNILFSGFSSDLNKIYGDADALLFPSYRESFGLVLIEALVRGVPCIALKPSVDVQTVSDEIITHGYNGFLVEDMQELRRLLCDLVVDKNELVKLSENAKLDARGKYDWKVFVKSLTDLCTTSESSVSVMQ